METLSIYMPVDRRHALAAGRTLPDRTAGSVLFTDISGFTPLTQALTKAFGARRGAEEVTRQCNQVFEALVAIVDHYGGSVIGFAGDAMLCWFDQGEGDGAVAAHRAVAAAVAMQARMAALAEIPLPDGALVHLAMKAAVASGPARRFVVGEPGIQLMDVLAGETLVRVAVGEQLATRGEVVADSPTVALLGSLVTVAAWRQDESDGQPYAVLGQLAALPEPCPWPELPPDALSEAELRPWILPPVYERLRAGLGDFLGEFRPAVALFLRFEGIDYDSDPAAGSKLDTFIQRVQTILAAHGGVLIQLTLGDKGSYLYAAFGAPVSHDDDANQAAAAALALRERSEGLAFLTAFQIGLSMGRTRAGAYGGLSRRTYGALGDQVNMAARLMMRAAPRGILASRAFVNHTQGDYHFGELHWINVKGSQEPLAVAELLGRRTAEMALGLSLAPLVARDGLLASLEELAEAAFQAQGSALALKGEAGIGKSHLARELARRAERLGFQVALGSCHSITQQVAYTPWQAIIATLLALDPALPEGAQIQQVTEALRLINPAWLVRLPLLGELLALPIPETPITAALEPRLRQEALLSLVVEIVQRLAGRQPLFLMLEDVHWIDESSALLCQRVGQAIEGLPVLLLMTSRLQAERPIEEELLPDGVARRHVVEVPPLERGGVAALVAQRLGGSPDPLLLALVAARTHGNPFFVQALTDALRERGQIVAEANGAWCLAPTLRERLRTLGAVRHDEDGWHLLPTADLTDATLELPDSVHGIVIARLDQLNETLRATVKVASVLGRVVPLRSLQAIHPSEPTLEDLEAQVRLLVRSDFLVLEALVPEQLYTFRQGITQEVAYETLLFAQRTALHRAVARLYEAAPHEGTPGPNYAVLAHHWQRAEEPERERHYATLAGEWAMAQHANEEAVRFLSRALDLTPIEAAGARFPLLLAREKVWDRRGARDAQAEDLRALAATAEALGASDAMGQAYLRAAHYAYVTHAYADAMQLARQVVSLARGNGDLALEVEGYLMCCRVAWQASNYPEAERYNARAIDLARRYGYEASEAAGLRLLANIHWYQGHYEQVQAALHQALEHYRALGNVEGEASCLSTLGAIAGERGDFLPAQAYYEEALTICRTIGYRWGEALILSNLSVDLTDLGQYQAAQGFLERALAIQRHLRNQKGEAISLDTLGLVFHGQGAPRKALRAYQQAIALQEAIGDQRGLAYTCNHLGHTLTALHRLDEAEAAYRRALALRQQAGEEALVNDSLAGLAEVARLRGAPDEALRLLAPVLAWIESQGSDGLEYPARVYLACARALAAQGSEHERAQALLAAAYELIQARAATIQDPTLRASFLENVEPHRELIAAWEGQQASAGR